MTGCWVAHHSDIVRQESTGTAGAACSALHGQASHGVVIAIFQYHAYLFTVVDVRDRVVISRLPTCITMEKGKYIDTSTRLP